MLIESIRLRRNLTCWFHDVVLIELDASTTNATSALPQVDGQPGRMLARAYPSEPATGSP
jgi:hypothetical protein